jgi:hypothetical protein
MNDPGIVGGITGAAGALTRPGSPPAEQRAGLAGLRDRLHDTVGRFAALPTGEPGRSDAAYCLFLHVHASSELRVLPAWPDIAARFLQIAAPGMAGQAGSAALAADDNLLQAAADIAGQAGQADAAAGAAEVRAGDRAGRNPATGEQPTCDRPGR